MGSIRPLWANSVRRVVVMIGELKVCLDKFIQANLTLSASMRLVPLTLQLNSG